ncbi:alpha/beta hydrolase [Erythrobacter sp. HL-111]|uniref:PHA/PHB synthase family protein n=1 Tax=Erythrobacter sp. HL-111 TaxID=1798193 RepID=UPI0006DA1765|nr:alpha/beta fold hydrolase [Erythrobacter sp. HL-111]KPP96510.1 MAG: class II polyhydroxyalkanoate synthase PhaC2 [Erythrobacteraceae bacterium HL-111]SDS07166.1 polyhydroxyalkanoate synthase [Erythrobacter sp. HL-111]
MADGVRLENEAAQSTNALGPLIGVAREDFVGAVALLLRETASDPARTFRHAQKMGEDMVKIMTGKSDLAPDPRDKRFLDPAWQFNPFYRAGVQYYLAVQKGMRGWLEDLELDELERNRANFIAQIILDGLSPTNTLAGNPTAQKRLIDSGGLSLIKGLQNAYNDIVHNKGMVSQVDKRPFKLGENIATSKGEVVLRTEMMELIHYAPTTAQVHEIPQLTIPPQINKMYINDLSPEKSVVKWQVDNGIQTFVISWRNPTKDQGKWGMAEYVASCEEAMEAVAAITGSDKVNVSAGCSGGQTASVLASKLAAKKSDLLGTLTLMVCVLHPEATDIEAGSLVSENGMQLARNRAKKAGVIAADDLARGFAWLRPNDLIWNYVINNYLLGADPPAFDVLFWNSDATNLSASLMGDFLTLYETLAFTKQGEVEMADHAIDLSRVTSDLFILGGVTDHITPWKATYRSTGLFGSKDVTYVLSQSGHMQAILNPPTNPKARYFVQAKKGRLPATADDWVKGAREVQGSWWPFWIEWLQARSGEKKPAPETLGNAEYRPVGPAPGLYVVEEV